MSRVSGRSLLVLVLKVVKVACFAYVKFQRESMLTSNNSSGIKLFVYCESILYCNRQCIPYNNNVNTKWNILLCVHSSVNCT